MLNNKRHLSLVCCLFLGVNWAFANTSGVHGPNVKEGEKSAQIRFALSPADEDDQNDNWTSRLHYQQAFNDQLRGRIILQVRDRGEFEYDYLRAELLYNFKKKQSDETWSSGVRFDVRTRKGQRPEEYAINWTNQWDLANNYRVRAILIASRQSGDDAFDGTEMSTRASLVKKLESGISIGVEMFNEYGEVGEFGRFNQQTHQIGPVVGGKIAGLKYEARYLAGVTSQGRDHNLGLRFTKAF